MWLVLKVLLAYRRPVFRNLQSQLGSTGYLRILSHKNLQLKDHIANIWPQIVGSLVIHSSKDLKYQVAILLPKDITILNLEFNLIELVTIFCDGIDIIFINITNQLV